MLKKIIYLSFFSFVVVGILAFTSVAQPKPKKKTKVKPAETVVVAANEIKWHTMSEGIAKAQKEKKILVVDVYTDWCYWCKVMDKETYANADIIAKMNQYAVAVKFNPEVNGSHLVNGETLSSDQLLSFLNKGSRNSGYPNTFFWKDFANNKAIDSYPGYREKDEFNGIINKYLNN